MLPKNGNIGSALKIKTLHNYRKDFFYFTWQAPDHFILWKQKVRHPKIAFLADFRLEHCHSSRD